MNKFASEALPFTLPRLHGVLAIRRSDIAHIGDNSDRGHVEFEMCFTCGRFLNVRIFARVMRNDGVPVPFEWQFEKA